MAKKADGTIIDGKNKALLRKERIMIKGGGRLRFAVMVVHNKSDDQFLGWVLHEYAPTAAKWYWRMVVPVLAGERSTEAQKRQAVGRRLDGAYRTRGQAVAALIEQAGIA